MTSSDVILDVSTSIKPPEPDADEHRHTITNGNEWTTTDDTKLKHDLQLTDDAILKFHADSSISKDVPKPSLDPPVPSPIPASTVMPCVGKFVIKRTSKINGEDRFTFRRKRRTKKAIEAAAAAAAALNIDIDKNGNVKRRRTTKKSAVPFCAADPVPTESQKATVRRKRQKKVTFNMPETSVEANSSMNDDFDGNLSNNTYEGADVNWSSIPIQVLLIIFKMGANSEGILSFSKRVSKVCRLWSEVVDDPSLWTHLDLSKPNVSMTSAQLRKLSQKRFSHVLELNLASWGRDLLVPDIEAISETCPLLTTLNLSGCERVTGSLLRLFINNCPKLTSLDISRMQSYTHVDSAVSTTSIGYLASKLGSKLLHLNISCNIVRGLRIVITIISEGFPELRELDMSSVDSPGRNPTPIHIEKLQEGCAKLRVLRLANVFFLRLAAIPLTEQASSPGFPDLEELSIAKVPDIYDQGLDESSLERILKTSRKLKLLDLRGCSLISSSSLVRTPAWDLEHLFLSWATRAMNSGIELVMQKWAHSLVEVDLSWNNQSSENLDLAVKALAELTPSESPLRKLDLCGSSVSFEPVKSVLCNCPKLEVLNLTSCRGLQRGIKRIYNAEDLEKLRIDVGASKMS